MYRNLEAEMARKGLTKLALAIKLKMRYATLIDKLNGKYRLYFEEAVNIRNEVNKEMDLDYLFQIEEEVMS